MHPLARDLWRHGFAVYNIEYRRFGLLGGGGGWSTSISDVEAALCSLNELAGVDMERIVICGHSVGAQLMLCALSRQHRLHSTRPTLRPRLAVSLAGIFDLVMVADANLGRGAARRFCGGLPQTVSEHYRESSPVALLPIGIEQLVVHGLADSVISPASSITYAQAARTRGDHVSLELLPDQGHVSMINPKGDAWHLVISRLTDTLDSTSAP
jgi:acetyl esterase/lipase